MSVTTDSELDDEKTDAEKTDAEKTDAEIADADTTDAEETSPERDEHEPVRSWRRRLIGGGLALLVAGSLATSGFLGWQLWQHHLVTRAGQQAQAAAVQYAQVLTSIDSAKVDENFNQVLDGATGEFKDMYSQSSMQLRQLLIDNKATAHGVVVESAIQSETKDTVVVLLFVDQSVSNSAVPDPRIDRSRVKMTMEYADGRWRAGKVELP